CRRHGGPHADAGHRHVLVAPRAAPAPADRLSLPRRAQEGARPGGRCLHPDRRGHRGPALDAGRAAGSRPVPVVTREGVRRGRARAGGTAAASGGPPHPAELDGPRHRGRDHRRRGGDHRRVHALVPGPRLPARHPDLGTAPVRRQGQPRLRPPLGDLPRHRDLPHRPLHQLHRRRTARRVGSEEGSRAMTDAELCFTPATELVALFRRRKVSPLELTRAVLARIEKVNPSLNAYCTVAAEQALAAAPRAAAALATGLGPLAQGSDLGGSLRIPAAFCGVVGFRTTPGLVPVWPATLAWDPWSVEGPMARTVADTALMLTAIAGPDPRAPLSFAVDTRTFTHAVRAPGIKGLRIAWGGGLGITPVDDEVLGVCHAATALLRALGA